MLRFELTLSYTESKQIGVELAKIDQSTEDQFQFKIAAEFVFICLRALAYS